MGLSLFGVVMRLFGVVLCCVVFMCDVASCYLWLILMMFVLICWIVYCCDVIGGVVVFVFVLFCNGL